MKDLGAAPLANAKHEAMIQFYAAGGLGQTDAYVRAGFRKDSGNAARAFERPECVLRLAWLQKQMSDKIVDVVVESAVQVKESRAWVIEQLILNARISMGQQPITVKSVGKSGATIKAERTERDAQAANRALHLLGLELGMFKTEVPAPPPEDIDQARNAADPKIAEQLRRYASGKPRLIASEGKTVAAKK